MKVIPVMDVLDGVAVHAVMGERRQYKPLKSVISVSPDPIEVARGFRRKGFGALYIADLNAIMGTGDNLDTIGRIARETGSRLMVDAGVSNIERAKVVIDRGASSVIVGTETLTRISFVEEAVHVLGPNCIVVSLDMKNGRLLAKFSLDEFKDTFDVLRKFQQIRIRRFIVLDLARVGSDMGIDVAFIRRVVKSLDIEVFVGGGVRSMDDLEELSEIGVAGVLLATSLHSGKITAEQIVAKGLSLT